MKLYLRKLLAASLLLTLASACASNTVQDVSTSPGPDRTLVYMTAGDRDLTLTLFRPAGKKTDTPSSAIMFFFGGGWKSAFPDQFHPQSAYFAELGVVAINVYYRTESTDAVPPVVSLMDAKSAMRWVRSHASELGIDPQRIAAGGGSAGGHLAAALAVIEEFNHADDDLSVSTRPDALVLYNPVIDNGPGGYGFDRVEPYWENFSPLHNIHDNHPPAIFFLGREDDLIPVTTGIAYKNAVEATGARMDLHLYEGESHGFFNNFRSVEMYEDTTSKAHGFLYDLGFIDTPPVIED